MKENAQRASAGGGGMQVVAKSVTKALAPLSAADRQNWELHVVGHSAGSIFAADALALLTGLGINFKTVQFMAPATRARDGLHLLVPHRFFTHGQNAQGDRHVYASRTRFIPAALMQHFEGVTWPLATAVTGRLQVARDVRIDVGAKMRSMWR
jgi:DNA helicase-2/ATP-dependent DNA helicase PcrA